MCHCLWVEYVCGCWRADCTHADPASPHYHASDSVWRAEHRAWQYCPAALLLLGGSGAVGVPTAPSDDPRHGGRVPLCGDVRYETWRMDRMCPACRDDLVSVRRTEGNLVGRGAGGMEPLSA
ncbi:hypothetical protein NKR23_g2084 [Pleurostoma richardsiae]|uniref:Uncharacterized protein n=1 Tax=Pleurostoma richardsiae TaxID=41990 RepID=A0AA38RRW1_9PEZI|nr:hypothetical protein NKR23_g2084 [Pleurostoma richardsiae]